MHEKRVQLYFDALSSRNKVTYDLPKWNSFLEILNLPSRNLQKMAEFDRKMARK